jgi:hypothetical protein
VAVTRDQLVERIAQVSHATWLVQGVEGGRELAYPFVAGPFEYKDTAEWASDLSRAREMLSAVLQGARLEELSDNPAHHVVKHDRERGENTVIELERLQIWSG